MKFNFEKKRMEKENFSLKLIPIVKAEEKLYSLSEDPQLKEKDIIYKIDIRSIFSGDEKTFGYFLRRDISEHEYLFRLVKNINEDYFGFAFKTKNYTKEQLLKEFPDKDIFIEFHYLFPESEKFQFENYKNLERKRWFEINVKKYLKNWYTENVEDSRADFFLKRNKD